MEFTNKFFVPLPLEDAWKLMLDVPRILPCLPGARLTEVLGNDTYRGAVSVKLGPVKLAFDGKAQMVKKDDAAHIAWLQGSGLDPKGRGSAQSEFSFALVPAPGGTQVTVTTQLQLSGAVAQYGRGSGMIAEVAGHILKQFERNLADSLSEDEAGHAAPLQGVGPGGALGADLFGAGAGSGAGAATGGGSGGDGAGAGAFVNPVSSRSPVMSATAAQHEQATATAPAPAEMRALYYQSQALLAQSQAVLAATQQALLKFETGSPAARRKAPQQELNMTSIALKAMWSRMFGHKE